MIRIISSLLIGLLSSCMPDDEVTSIPQVPENGFYITDQFEETDLLVSFNIPYSIRENYDGIQYTAGNRKETEAGLEELTLYMDVAVPPNARASSPQPLVIMTLGDQNLHRLE